MPTFSRVCRRILPCLLLLLLPLMMPSRVSAQFDNGSLVGTIKDASGAAIPGAVVTITNAATAILTQVKADASGNYEVPSLRVGVYRVVGLN